LKVKRLLQLTALAKMVKIVPSFEHMLKKKIEALEAKLAQLGAENEHLKVENVRLSLLTLGKQAHKTALASKTLTVERPSNTPSYARPTVASTNRTVKSIVVEDGKNFVDDRSPMYVDGKLVVLDKPRPHYQLSTRAKGSYDGFWGDFSTFGQEQKTRWVTYSRPSSPTAEKIRWNYACESCNKLEADFKDDSAHSLAAACVNIPYRTQHRLLHSAFTLCQDIIWHHLRNHCPSRQIEHCFEGPREVAFCRSELMGLIAGVNWNWQNHDLTHVLTSAMIGVTDLRNTLAHQNRVNLAMVDILLTRAQKLAVVCGDERRAMRLRGLRDELRMHAEKAVTNIDEKYYGTWGPFQPKGRQWALHHQRTFHDLTKAFKDGKLWRYNPAPDVVKMAAWEWKAENGNCVLGSLNHEYVAALERASSRLVENGRLSPSDDEKTDEEFGAASEKSDKAAILVADDSDEGEKEALQNSGAW
jgi:hypothetical protein